MSLPKIQYPTYQIEIPSTKERHSFRPFLVKEEKILLMALQGGNQEEMVDAIKQIINNCFLTPGFDVNKLLIYDLEYVFLQMRIKSVGEKLTLKFQPRQNTECEECKKVRTVVADLNQAFIEKKENHTNKLDLGNGYGIVMKYPGVKILSEYEKFNTTTSVDDYFSLIWKCIESVYDPEKMYPATEYSEKDGFEFLGSLNHDQFSLIESFFRDLPKLKLDVKVKCSKCDFEEIYPIVGLENFFV